MNGPGLGMLLLSVLAPMASGALTLALPARAATGRVLLALAGMVASVVGLGVFLGAHGLGAPPTGVALAPSIELNLTFLVDELGAFFGLLVAGVGALIVVYARGYFGPDEASLRRFYPLLGLFATAMMGLVLSDNVLGLFVFWEMTTVSSFLLIGWNFRKPDAVRLAMQALITTGLGGLVLLAGLITLGVSTGSWSLSGVNAALAGGGAADGLAATAFALVFIGCAAKSAQWPLHFWLPGAMAAPTPVSAYLHSATMVKAGVYLLARLHPGMSGVAGWTIVLTAFGAATMLLGGFLALRSDALKKIFAYTTVSQLGLLVCAYGLGGVSYKGETNLIWPVVQIANHALYKAPLFMLAGAIAATTGFTALAQLGGLWRRRRVLSVVLIGAAAALAGLPLTLSFTAKEAFFYQAAHAATVSPWFWIVGAMGVATAACNVAIFVRLTRVVLGPDGPDEPKAKAPDPSRAWAACAWLPAAALIAVQLIGGVAPGVVEWMLRGVETHPLYWDHLPGVVHAATDPGAALLMSAIAIGLGVGVALSGVLRGAVRDPHDGLVPAAMRGGESIGYRVLRLLQNGDLRIYLVVVLGGLLAALGAVAATSPGALRAPAVLWISQAPVTFVVGLGMLCGLVCATALIIPMITARIMRVLMLGACGFCVTAMYLIYQAPDLALTQIMFELISVVLFLLVLRLLPERAAADARPGPPERAGRWLVGGLMGLVVGWIVLTVGSTVDHENVERLAGVSAPTPAGEVEVIASAAPSGGPAAGREAEAGASALDAGPASEVGERLGPWFLEHSYKGSPDTGDRGGGGHNAVNVILVDFRGYDTLGEITVLAITMMGVLALLFSASPAMMFTPGGPQPHLRSSLLRTAMKLNLPLTLIYAGYVFFKGHNLPGGGFIAGLIASVGLAVYRMSEGGRQLRRLLPLRPGTLAAVGLAIALATALAPMAIGLLRGESLPALQSHNEYVPLPGGMFHFTSVLFFDLGVFIVVVAVSAGMINRFEEELE